MSGDHLLAADLDWIDLMDDDAVAAAAVEHLLTGGQIGHTDSPLPAGPLDLPQELQGAVGGAGPAPQQQQPAAQNEEDNFHELDTGFPTAPETGDRPRPLVSTCAPAGESPSFAFQMGEDERRSRFRIITQLEEKGGAGVREVKSKGACLGGTIKLPKEALEEGAGAKLDIRTIGKEGCSHPSWISAQGDRGQHPILRSTDRCLKIRLTATGPPSPVKLKAAKRRKHDNEASPAMASSRGLAVVGMGVNGADLDRSDALGPDGKIDLGKLKLNVLTAEVKNGSNKGKKGSGKIATTQTGVDGPMGYKVFVTDEYKEMFKATIPDEELAAYSKMYLNGGQHMHVVRLLARLSWYSKAKRRVGAVAVSGPILDTGSHFSRDVRGVQAVGPRVDVCTKGGRLVLTMAEEVAKDMIEAGLFDENKQFLWFCPIVNVNHRHVVVEIPPYLNPPEDCIGLMEPTKFFVRLKSVFAEDFPVEDGALIVIYPHLDDDIRDPHCRSLRIVENVKEGKDGYRHMGSEATDADQTPAPSDGLDLSSLIEFQSSPCVISSPGGVTRDGGDVSASTALTATNMRRRTRKTVGRRTKTGTTTTNAKDADRVRGSHAASLGRGHTTLYLWFLGAAAMVVLALLLAWLKNLG